MKAKIRDTEIYFDVAGMQLVPAGKELIEKPVLFMLHGGPGADHVRYKHHSIELQDDAQLIFIDNRGCGRSKKSRPETYTLENNVEDIEALRQYLGLNRIAMLGTSYGGMTALAYAIRYPKHLDKLIVVAAAPSYRFLKQAQAYLQTHGSEEQIDIAQHLWNGSFKNPQHVWEFIQLMDNVYSVSATRNAKNKQSKASTLWSHHALNLGFGGFLRKFDIIPKLKRITCPTLILAGDKDWICQPDQAKTIAKHIPQAELKIFKNCGHAVAVDAHDKYIKAIRTFLKS